MKVHGIGSSPGTSSRISDTQMFLYIGNNKAFESDGCIGSAGMSLSSTTSSEHTQYELALENRWSTSSKRPSAINNVAAGLKRILQLNQVKDKKSEKRFKKSLDEGSVDSCRKWNLSDETPTSPRQRFFRHSALASNKRSLCVRSYQSSPIAKKRFASGVAHGVMQSLPQVKVSGRSSSSSFSISFSSPRSNDKQKGMCMDNDDVAGPSCSSHLHEKEPGKKSFC